ncbi:DUF6221 family protein [Streptomyces parvus]|uniref:DUF6221 family protein n=1 Tax=Streptomyces parvus TaxID=66428 RepID=UPI003CC72DA9
MVRPRGRRQAARQASSGLMVDTRRIRGSLMNVAEVDALAAAHYWSIKALAAVYADHPDYLSEWRP